MRQRGKKQPRRPRMNNVTRYTTQNPSQQLMQWFLGSCRAAEGEANRTNEGNEQQTANNKRS